MTDICKDFYPTPENYNEPYDKRSFESGYQAGRAHDIEVEQDMLSDLQTTMQALESAKKYMAHKSGCSLGFLGGGCDCGYDKLRKTINNILGAKL